MSAAVIYCRISHDAEGDQLGVERQERLCRDLAERRGISIADVLVDNDFSAYKRRQRPAFERLVDELRRGAVDTVIAYHADRLYRRTTDLERLVEIVETTQAAVHTVAAGDVDLATASGRMVARMLGAAAQHESERIGERMKAKHDELANAGKAPGGRPPYGYTRRDRDADTGKLSGSYVVDPTEAEVVRRAARRVLEGASLLKVARELTADGIPTREGRAWHHSSVRAALVNPAIAALRVHRREIAGPGNWEPVLDRATWEQVRLVLTDPARKRTRPARRYLLAGLVLTPNGDPMNGRPARGADGAERRTYATRMPTSGVSMAVSADDLEDVVEQAVLASVDEAAIPTPEPVARNGAEIAAIEAELAELAQLRGDGTISLAEWMAARQPLLGRLEAAKANTAATALPGPLEHLLAKPGAVRNAWPELDLDAKRRIISLLIERVIVTSATRGRWTTIGERLDPERGGGIIWRA